MRRSNKREACRVVRFSPDLAELRRIRGFVDGEARRLGLSEARAFDLRLLVSEACANAIEHSDRQGDLLLTVTSQDGMVEVEIVHGGRISPMIAFPEKLHRGLGLPLMASLADRLTIAKLPEGGTSVRLMMYLSAY